MQLQHGWALSFRLWGPTLKICLRIAQFSYKTVKHILCARRLLVIYNVLFLKKSLSAFLKYALLQLLPNWSLKITHFGGELYYVAKNVKLDFCKNHICRLHILSAYWCILMHQNITKRIHESINILKRMKIH